MFYKSRLIASVIYMDGNHKRRVASVGNKGKWPLSKASCLHNDDDDDDVYSARRH